MSGNKFEMVLTYYKNSLDEKNKEISHLRELLEEKEKEKEELRSKIENLKFQNFKIKEGYEKNLFLENLKNQKSLSNYEKSEDVLQRLQRENEMLRKENENLRNKIDLLYDEEIMCGSCKKLNEKVTDDDIVIKSYEDVIKRMSRFYTKMNRRFTNTNDALIFEREGDISEFKDKMFKIETNVYSQVGLSNEENNFYIQKQKIDDNRDELFFPNRKY